MLSDSNFVRQPSQRLDPSKTVFVGALHGMMTAEGLAHFMNDLFGNVVYAGIDTDKHKYPIGKLSTLCIRVPRPYLEIIPFPVDRPGGFILRLYPAAFFFFFFNNFFLYFSHFMSDF